MRCKGDRMELTDCSRSRHSTERPLNCALPLGRRERQQWIVEPPAGALVRMGVNDPLPTSRGTDSRH